MKVRFRNFLKSNDFTNELDLPKFNNQLLEVLPMNSEQREAVVNALNLPISVITGPQEQENLKL